MSALKYSKLLAELDAGEIEFRDIQRHLKQFGFVAQGNREKLTTTLRDHLQSLIGSGGSNADEEEPQAPAPPSATPPSPPAAAITPAETADSDETTSTPELTAQVSGLLGGSVENEPTIVDSDRSHLHQLYREYNIQADTRAWLEKVARDKTGLVAQLSDGRRRMYSEGAAITWASRLRQDAAASGRQVVFFWNDVILDHWKDQGDES